MNSLLYLKYLAENRVLKKTFFLKSNEMREEWRRLHIGEHHSLHSSTNIKMKNSMIGWTCGMYGRGESRTRGLGGEALEGVHLGDEGLQGRVMLNTRCKNCLKGRGVG